MRDTKKYIQSLKGKNVLVVGMGKSGMAATKVLFELGANVTVQDSKTEDTLDKAFARFLNNNQIAKELGSVPEDLASFDMFVLSPGVPTNLPWIVNAKHAGVEVIGEFELAYRINDATYIGITGTNGKTTTTTLVGDIFYEAGKKTFVVGNIGTAVVSEAMQAKEGDYMVAEASSFQLETTKEFRPHVAAILNLTPDHLNRHKTFEAYGEAKAKIFENQEENDYLVLNFDDEATYSLVQNCRAKLVPFSRKHILDFGAYLREGNLVINDGNSEKILCNKDELKIIGNHNIENALAAAAISYFAGIDIEVISKILKTFPGVAHRIEFCGDVDSVAYYNDSKGTNVDAAVIALRALENNIHLIAGGDGKSQDFTDLANELNGRVKTLILFGRDASLIEEAAKKAGFTNIINCKDMVECVSAARNVANKGDKVLLSPACASWDMYDNYEQRGDHFRSIVDQMLK